MLIGLLCFFPLLGKESIKKKKSKKVPSHLSLCPNAIKSPLLLNYKRYCRNPLRFPKGGPIPKVLHQIWVGGPLPEKYKPFIQAWKDLHPDWEFKLWTDEDVDAFPWINRAVFDTAKNPGMKSDIWRYEILYQYGGVYLDVDFYPLKSFNFFAERFDMFLGLTSFGGTYNGLMGGVPKHKIFKDLIDKLREGVKEEHGFSEIIASTGPGFLENLLFSTYHEYANDPVIFFPYFYFYALSGGENLVIPNPPSKKQLAPFPEDCLYAVHYWGHSWVEW